MPGALHEQCVDAAAAVVAGLGLSGIGKNVVTQTEHDEANTERPCVLVSIGGEAETVLNLSSGSRVVGYPVRLEFLAQADSSEAEDLGAWSTWREAVVDAFPDRRAAGYPAAVHGCDVLPGVVADGRSKATRRLYGTLLLRFKVARKV